MPRTPVLFYLGLDRKLTSFLKELIGVMLFSSAPDTSALDSIRESP